MPFIFMNTFHSQMTWPSKAQADIILTSLVEKNKTPSVQYLIFNKDSIIYSFISGDADISGKKKAGKETIYNAFSVTKTFTAIAILQLSEQKIIYLNAPVKKYLSNFPFDPSITVKQLLSHTSGIPNPLPLRWIHLPQEHDSFDRNSFFRPIFEHHKKLKSTPGERYSYSNLGYVILGQLIEKVTGVTYEQYITENILNKLLLSQEECRFTIDDSTVHAKGYQKKVGFSNLILGLLFDKSKYLTNSEGKWKAYRKFYVNGPSYGGLIATPCSFVKYIQDLLKRNSLLLSSESKSILFTETLTNDGKRTGMCLSWFSGQSDGKHYFAHAGGGGGYYCEIRIYPEKGIGSVIMFNRTGMSDERYLDKVDKYYFKED
jgi:D-alanyl-D-alanine carboxypeptidase